MPRFSLCRNAWRLTCHAINLTWRIAPGTCTPYLQLPRYSTFGVAASCSLQQHSGYSYVLSELCFTKSRMLVAVGPTYSHLIIPFVLQSTYQPDNILRHSSASTAAAYTTFRLTHGFYIDNGQSFNAVERTDRGLLPLGHWQQTVGTQTCIDLPLWFEGSVCLGIRRKILSLASRAGIEDHMPQELSPGTKSNSKISTAIFSVSRTGCMCKCWRLASHTTEQPFPRLLPATWPLRVPHLFLLTPV
jgi:hypothetical protein